jgi:hypothetical protein
MMRTAITKFETLIRPDRGAPRRYLAPIERAIDLPFKTLGQRLAASLAAVRAGAHRRQRSLDQTSPGTHARA